MRKLQYTEYLLSDIANILKSLPLSAPVSETCLPATRQNTMRILVIKE